MEAPFGSTGGSSMIDDARTRGRRGTGIDQARQPRRKALIEIAFRSLSAARARGIVARHANTISPACAGSLGDQNSMRVGREGRRPARRACIGTRRIRSILRIRFFPKPAILHGQRNMNSSLRSPLFFWTASFLAGIGLGNFQRSAILPESTGLAPSAEASGDPAQEPTEASGPAKEAFGEVAPGSAFSGLSLEEQTASVLRLAAKVGETPSLQFLLVQLAATLPPDSLAHILEALSDGKSGENIYAKSVFAERLASTDPRRVLTLGTGKKDPLLIQQGMHALIQQNAAEAVKTWASLPPELRSEPSGTLGGHLVIPGGSVSEVVSALKSEPKLVENIAESKAGGWVLVQILGMLSAKTATIDTAQALSEMRNAADEILKASAKHSPNLPEIERIKQRDALVTRMVDQALDTLRADSTAISSGFFNALKDSEKRRWEYGTEAVARFKHAGSETAISFAESQNEKENMSMAATGVWWALATENRASALQWIESLPPGAFRAGCLKSVMMDAWTQTQSWGDAQIAIEAGSRLLSRNSRLDYYSEMLGEMHFGNGDGRSRSDYIAALPLTVEERVELERRTAPIKPR